jgi:hypothetical protein
MNKYEINNENPYFKIKTIFTANWDCTRFFVDKEPMTQEQIDYFHNNGDMVDIISTENE